MSNVTVKACSAAELLQYFEAANKDPNFMRGKHYAEQLAAKNIKVFPQNIKLWNVDKLFKEAITFFNLQTQFMPPGSTKEEGSERMRAYYEGFKEAITQVTETMSNRKLAKARARRHRNKMKKSSGQFSVDPWGQREPLTPQELAAQVKAINAASSTGAPASHVTKAKQPKKSGKKNRRGGRYGKSKKAQTPLEKPTSTPVEKPKAKPAKAEERAKALVKITPGKAAKVEAERLKPADAKGPVKITPEETARIEAERVEAERLKAFAAEEKAAAKSRSKAKRRFDAFEADVESAIAAGITPVVFESLKGRVTAEEGKVIAAKNFLDPMSDQDGVEFSRQQRVHAVAQDTFTKFCEAYSKAEKDYFRELSIPVRCLLMRVQLMNRAGNPIPLDGGFTAELTQTLKICAIFKIDVGGLNTSVDQATRETIRGSLISSIPDNKHTPRDLYGQLATGVVTIEDVLEKMGL